MQCSRLRFLATLLLGVLWLGGTAVAQTQEAKLTAPSGDEGDHFGRSVSISGDGATALVGADSDEDDEGDDDKGSAYVFTRSSDGTWAYQDRLTAFFDGVAGDQFGTSVSLDADGSTALVGARNDGGNFNSGSAYVFEPDADGTWIEQAELGDPSEEADVIGYPVALSADGTVALVSTTLFTKDGSGDWVRQDDLIAPSEIDDANFGGAVSLSADGSAALIAADKADVDGNIRQGRAYVFARGETGDWSQQGSLTASDGEAYEEFGTSVSLSADGSVAVVGVQRDEVGGTTFQGSAYVFVRDEAGTWTEQEKLTVSDGSEDDYFGYSVSLDADGSAVLVGAYSDQAYVFAYDQEDGWSEQVRLTASDGESGDTFGNAASFSADGSTALVGAIYDDVGGSDSQGSAYVFGLPAEASAPVATTEAATNVTQTSAQLNGRVDPNGAETTVSFIYHPSGFPGQAQTVTADQSPLTGDEEQDVSAAATFLQGETEYTYYVSAENSEGIVNGTEVTFTTSAAAPTATTEPATDVMQTTAQLHGRVDPKGASTFVSFEYFPTGEPGQAETVEADESPLSGTGEQDVSATVSGLQSGTGYTYRVTAANTGGSVAGSDRSFATQPAGPAVFVVNSVGDSSDTNPGDAMCDTGGTVDGETECTLRAAIEEARVTNPAPGGDVDSIRFDISGSEPHVIQPATPLPVVASHDVIDGTWGRHEPFPPIVVIDGSQMQSSGSGLTVSATTEIKSLSIINFDEHGLVLQGTLLPGGAMLRNTVTVTDCYIGVHAGGNQAGNGKSGILIDDGAIGKIGSHSARLGNVISDNGEHGILIRSDSSVVTGNLVGTNLSGGSAMGNGGHGILAENAFGTTVGGTGADDRNVISGNGMNGIWIDGGSADIGANYIGTDAGGDVALGNGGDGVVISNGAAASRVGHNELTGALPLMEGNVISGNGGNGVRITGAETDSVIVQGNMIGLTSAGAAIDPGDEDDATLFNGSHGILVTGGASASQIGGGVNSRLGVGNVVAANSSSMGIALETDDNTVQGNYVGTNRKGADFGVMSLGILVRGDGNLVGSRLPSHRPGERQNDVANVDGPGIRITGSNNEVARNHVGTNGDGDDLGNAGNGIEIVGEASGNVIGLFYKGALGEPFPVGNTVAFNDGSGIVVKLADGHRPTGNVIRANTILSNGALGIDLGDDGVTPNDVGDGDDGPNHLQNFPEIDSAAVESNGDLTVTYRVDAVGANASFPLTVDFYRSSGPQQADAYLGTDTYTSAVAQNRRTVTLTPDRSVSDGDSLLATATDGAGNTSELSAPFLLGGVPRVSVSLLDDIMGTAGTQDEIPVEIGDLTGRGVTSFRLEIEYDPALLEVSGVSSEGTLSEPMRLFEVNTNNDGEVIVGAADSLALSGSGALLNLEVEYQAAGNFTLSFAEALLNEGDPPAETQDGAGTITRVLYGDADLNDSVNPNDAAVVLQHSVGLAQLQGAALVAAEVSGNGSIFPYDASLILQFYVERITCFPVASGCQTGGKRALAASGRLAWGAPQTTHEADVVEVPLVLSDAEGVRSLMVEAALDASAYAVEEVTSSLGREAALAHEVAGDTLRLAAASAETFGGEVATVRLRRTQRDAAPTLAGSWRANEGAEQTLAAAEAVETPDDYALAQNYPNPFNPETTIRYTLPERVEVQLTVFDMLGREVAVLVDEKKESGRHHVRFDARELPSGVYFYRIEAGDFTQTREMMLVK